MCVRKIFPLLCLIYALYIFSLSISFFISFFFSFSFSFSFCLIGLGRVREG